MKIQLYNDDTTIELRDLSANKLPTLSLTYQDEGYDFSIAHIYFEKRKSENDNAIYVVVEISGQIIKINTNNGEIKTERRW